MIYLLCLIVSLNIVLLVEVVSGHLIQQEQRGLNVSFGWTFVLFFAGVIILSAVIFGITRYFNLG